MSDQERGPGSALTLIPKPDGAAPAHALDPRRSGEPRTSTVPVSREALFDLLQEIKQLAPCHRDPHRFHQRKDEIASRLFSMATAS